MCRMCVGVRSIGCQLIHVPSAMPPGRCPCSRRRHARTREHVSSTESSSPSPSGSAVPSTPASEAKEEAEAASERLSIGGS